MSEPVLHHFRFNKAVKLRAADARLTADAGVLLLREFDHAANITQHLAQQLHDPRDPARIRYDNTCLLRERIYALALGHSRQDDLDHLAHDPAFRAACWNRPGQQVIDERLASQPSHSRLVERLADPVHPGNLEAIRQALAHAVRAHQRLDKNARVAVGVVDTDGFPVVVHGQKQAAAAFNGYYKDTVYNPLVACFSVRGDFNAPRLGEGFLHATLRKGNAAPAAGARRFLRHASRKAHQLAVTVGHRLDAGFADAATFNMLDGLGDFFVCRLPHNPVLERLAAPYLARPAGRPPKDGYEFTVELDGYCQSGWKRPYRVVLVVVDRPQADGRLDFGPEYFFLVTNWPPERMPASELLEHYRQRGTFEDRLGEWNGLDAHLSHESFRANEAMLLLSLLAFNMAEALRGEFESARDPRDNPPATPEGAGCDLGRFRRVVLRCGARVVKSGRRLWFDLASGVSPLWAAVLDRLGRWKPPVTSRAARVDRRPGSVCGFMPAPAWSYRVATYRM